MPRPAVRATPIAALALTALLAGLTGCTKPSATGSGGPLPLTTRSAGPRTAPPGTPVRTTAPPPTGGATPTFAENAAVPCNGYPSADQVIAYLRRTAGMLGNAQVTVNTGPLCAGTWQYTVISVPDQDPLQVVTRGAPAALQLVTAGTDVCSEVSVRASAPGGIREAARC